MDGSLQMNDWAPDARERTCYAVASEVLAHKGVSDESYAAAKKTMGLAWR